MKKYNKTSLIIFARYPVGGKVKTRLAEDMGDAFAAKFYKICAEHTFAECRKLTDAGIKCFLFFSDPAEKKLIENWVGAGFEFMPQSGRNLGERMSAAFEIVFELGAEKALIIGTDLPDISAESIEEAAEGLKKTEAVIGPAADGGYYLLGVKKYDPELFIDIKWSTGAVFEQTISKLAEKKITTSLLPEMNDIDTKEDLILWLGNMSSDEPRSLKISASELFEAAEKNTGND